MGKPDVIRFPDNWTPNRVIVEERKDDSGKTDYHWGNKGDNSTNEDGSKHKGHTVTNSDGEIVYTRDMGGNEKINK
jgi:hypothetical protein